MQNKNSSIRCPCCSNHTYAKCCEKFHMGQLPDSALKLMRSRYSAYALNIPKYIINTTHQKNPQYNHNIELWTKEISHFCLNTTFKKLEILDFQENASFTTVTFTAHLTQNNKDASFTEKSCFEKVNGKWLYLKIIN